ncbi:M56 family metallopeptidase [Paenibacillus albicereus]|uniref:M56 family metallopeptidase n=1 Tax=Paenibacillus albicereus TaxID=2726185 RepID=A0A6H2H310_9BACL|nr:M56 family metallopeptidase [Paenibacillus albicereus]QJC54047.1 M56 family metallopeptidase [Paenibacillus albicereus]
MRMLETIVLLLLQASIGSSALIALVLLVRRWREGPMLPRMLPLLWLLVLVKLLVPALPATPLQLMPHVAGLSGPSSPALQEPSSAGAVTASAEQAAPGLPEGAGLASADFSDSASPAGAGLHPATPMQQASGEAAAGGAWLRIAAFAWLAGLIALSSIGLFAALRFRHRLKQAIPVTESAVLRQLDALSGQLGLRRRVRLYEHADRSGPCVYGLMRPAIYLPAGFAVEADPRQLSHVLLHELTHVKRNDLPLGALWSLAAAIYWFNPLVWLALRSVKADREVACDAGVLDLLGMQERTAYGTTLLQLARRPGPRPHFALPFARFPRKRGKRKLDELKRRIGMIASFREASSYRLSYPALALAVAAGLALILTISVPLRSSAATEAPPTSEAGRGSESLGITRIMDDFKWFSSLDRLRVHASFDFKVPDALPEGYKLSYLNLQQAWQINPELSTITYESGKTSDTYRREFVLKVSKEDLRNEYKEKPGSELRTSAPAMWGEAAPITFRHEPATFAGIPGTLVTQIQTYAWHLPEHAKTFVWEDGGIWYALEYFSENHSREEGLPQHWKNLSDAQRDQVLRSFVWPDQLQRTDYSGEGQSFPLYDTDDLADARRSLGFEPALPRALLKDRLRIRDARMMFRDDQYADDPFHILSDALRTTYRAPSEKPIGDLNAEVVFYQSRGPLADEEKLLSSSRIWIQGLEVTSVMDPTSNFNPYGIDKGFQDLGYSHRYYFWEHEGLHYLAFFRDLDEVQPELLRELVIKTLEPAASQPGPE